jgi:hypothetical protein
MNLSRNLRRFIKNKKGASSLFYSLLLFGICVQLSAYCIWSFNVFGDLVQYPLGSASEINNLNNVFSIDLWSGLVGGTGIVISVAMLLLRQNTYAIYALLLMVIGIFFNIIKGFVFAIPNLVAAIFGAAGVPSGIFNPIQVVVGVIITFAGFMYLAGLAAQRKLD